MKRALYNLSSRSAARRCARLAVFGVTLALGLTSFESAATAQNVALDKICQINFSERRVVPYGDQNLESLTIVGKYVIKQDELFGWGVEVPFHVMDMDGLLTAAFMHAQWRSSGVVHQNLTEPVLVPRRDLEILRDAASRGSRYLDYIESASRANKEPNLAAILVEIGEKRRVLLGISWLAVQALERPSPTSNVLLAEGVISERLGAALERFVAGSARPLVSQYRDLATSNRSDSILCDPQAESALIGKLLCGFGFTTAERRDATFCPEGLLVDELAATRSCRIVNNVRTDCR